MKTKEDKIYTYIILGIGLLIWIVYFYLHTNRWISYYNDFKYYWIKILGANDNFVDFLFVALQICFVCSWWYIRDDLVKLIKFIHSKV